MASNSDTPWEVIEELLDDEDMDVAKAARKTLDKWVMRMKKMMTKLDLAGATGQYFLTGLTGLTRFGLTNNPYMISYMTS